MKNDYVIQFRDSVRFGQKLIEKNHSLEIPKDQSQRDIESVKTITYQEPWLSLFQKIELEADEFVRSPPIPLRSKCHVANHWFDMLIHNQLSPELPRVLHLTVGNVLYRGEQLYSASRSNLKKEIRQGPDNTNPLNCHVWLTRLDYSVVDITVMANLQYRGLISDSVYTDRPVVIWREEDVSEFQYQPLLVHNRFAKLVDILPS